QLEVLFVAGIIVYNVNNNKNGFVSILRYSKTYYVYLLHIGYHSKFLNVGIPFTFSANFSLSDKRNLVEDDFTNIPLLTIFVKSKSYKINTLRSELFQHDYLSKIHEIAIWMLMFVKNHSLRRYKHSNW
ncbi:4080_t:CDS:2, partial [Gigaspora rosea]